MNATRREEMRHRTREAGECAYAAYKRGQRILIWGIIAGAVTSALAFAATSLFLAARIHHTGFDWALAGLRVLMWLGFTAIAWDGWSLWDRWRRLR